MQRLWILNIWFVLLSSGVVNSKPVSSGDIDNLNIRLYTQENKLSQTQPTCIYQDTRGFLWIGTSNGLNRFDVNSFEVIRHPPHDRISIICNHIYSIWNDKSSFIKIPVKIPVWQTDIEYFLYGIVIIFLIYILGQYRTKSLRKANLILKEKEIASLEVERQRRELAIKNKSITSSIQYARKIQEALLPSDQLFKKLLPDSFILFKPKDIVSGDFYWITERNNKVFVSAVDCTGHGVPGAFMSLIGFDILENIIKVQGVEKPSEILNFLSMGIENIFHRDEEDYLLRDGMDLSFCAIDREKRQLEYAGAFNPLYLIRDNKLMETRADRFSISLKHELHKQNQFTNHSISLKKGDMIYLFSDGYPDQFGGPNAKKFMYRRFRHMLLTIHKLPSQEQKDFLEESIQAWKGKNDQVDDILVIGIRPLPY